MTSNSAHRLSRSTCTLYVAIIRQARAYDAREINDIAAASASDMTPGTRYIRHASDNRQRIEHCGRNHVLELIDRSLAEPQLQCAFVATLFLGGSAPPRINQQIVGYIFGSANAGHALIQGAAIDSAWRLWGLGQTLVTAACEWAQGVRLPVRALVADTNEPMLKLLTGKGFKHISQLLPEETRPTYLIMEQDVQPPPKLVAIAPGRITQ